MKSQNQKITGVILAGGRNSRFGSEKALASVDSIRTIDNILSVMKEVFSDNVIITNTRNKKLYKEFNLKLYPDIVPGKGPLMGIYTAFSHYPTDIFVTGCDMPFLKAGVIMEIVKNLGSFDAAIPKYNGKLHFLHAAYSFRCFNLIKKKLDMGFLGLRDLAEDLNYNVVEGFRFDDDHFSPFFNMNTPNDFVLAKNYWKNLTTNSKPVEGDKIS